MAAELLEKKGYKILHRNWRMGHLEMDIIAANKKDIVFAEVKTRTSTFCGQPEEAVDILKRKRMVAAANAYIKYYKEERNLRFDIIGSCQLARKSWFNSYLRRYCAETYPLWFIFEGA